ncbi:hypothetical protein FB567DRAFT_528308 [Paraphoma chrysanthemicola]|uniref:Uncharacterized protein n=1 Tax=Paraphoma chrysanthemicola TaxID=798071 RepID=A0A8K0R657_9PLEO|nr:hypothetical protein FB567DRAFT_528308 [Paraphoma chrysanthemicola]
MDATSEDRSQNRNTPGNGRFMQLPDELIVLIIDYATYVPVTERAYRHYTNKQMHKPAYDLDRSLVKVLCLVCVRIRRIVQPFLFRDVTFTASTCTIPPSPNVLKLWDVLKIRQDLRQYCRSLHTNGCNTNLAKDPDSWNVMQDFAKWMTNITYLSIHGGFSFRGSNARTWDLIRTMASNMKEVEELVIKGTWRTVPLEELFDNLDFPSLRTLRLLGFSAGKHELPILPTNKHRTAPFTELCITNYEQPLKNMAILLNWPAALTRFECDNRYFVREIEGLDTLLLVHKDTLKHIELGVMFLKNDWHIFNARLFPALEFLRLSRWAMPKHLTREAMINVLGPSLKTIVWDFALSERRIEDWRSLSEYETTWLRLLASIASKHVNVLERVMLKFTHKYWGNAEELGYLWGDVDMMRAEVMRPAGIDLIHNEPEIVVKDW